MPGRHGSGPLGGGGGGGFRGGGWGRGPRYGGGGWGYRPRYGGWGWGWRPRFWGWGFPGFFGPRFGFGWGFGGSGCMLLIGLAILFIFLGGLFGGFGGYNSNNPGQSGPYGGNGNNGNFGGGLNNQPPSVQTQTAVDLAELNNALNNRIPLWQQQVGTNEEQHISASDAGMGNDNNIKDIVYGKCGSAFYVFVIDKDVPYNAGGADASGYAFTTSTSPATCHPSEYRVTDSEDDGGGWYFIYVQTLTQPQSSQ